MSDQDPFAALIQVSHPIVCAATRKYLRVADDNEDVMQEVYLILYTQWRKGKLQEVVRPDSYVYTVTKNICLNKNRKKEILPLDDIPEPMAPEYTGAPTELVVALRHAMDQIPEKYTQVLRLVLQGYTPTEIGQTLQVPLNTIKSLLLRGKKKMRRILEKKGGFYGYLS